MNRDQIAAEAAREISKRWRNGSFRKNGGVVAGITPIIANAIEKAVAPVEQVRDEWCNEYVQVRDELAAARTAQPNTQITNGHEAHNS